MRVEIITGKLVTVAVVCCPPDRYSSWHPFQILGKQDSPPIMSDSPFAWASSSMTGATDSVQTGGDDLITYSFNTWASYLSDGFTEFIEVGTASTMAHFSFLS